MVTGVLFIVFGGISGFIGFISVLAAQLANDLWGASGHLAYLVQAGFSIFAGIALVANAANVHKANHLRLVVIAQLILLVFPFVSNIVLSIAMPGSADYLFSPAAALALFGLPVPIAALLGVRKNSLAALFLEIENTPKQ